MENTSFKKGDVVVHLHLPDVRRFDSPTVIIQREELASVGPKFFRFKQIWGDENRATDDHLFENVDAALNTKTESFSPLMDIVVRMTDNLEREVEKFIQHIKEEIELWKLNLEITIEELETDTCDGAKRRQAILKERLAWLKKPLQTVARGIELKAEVA